MTGLGSAQEIVKVVVALLTGVAGALAAVGACVKLRQHALERESQRLKERHERLDALLASGGIDQAHPALVEAAFAAAVGCRGISAPTIGFLLRPDNPAPLDAVDLFIDGRPYLNVNRYDGRIRLAPRAENRLCWLFGYFAALTLAGVLLLTFKLRESLVANDWSNAGAGLLVGSLLATAGFFFLRQATRVAAAIRLTKDILADDQHAAAAAQQDPPSHP